LDGCVACSFRVRIIQPEAPLAKAGRQLVIATSDPEYAQLVRYWH
jgi:hypothetical protein